MQLTTRTLLENSQDLLSCHVANPAHPQPHCTARDAEQLSICLQVEQSKQLLILLPQMPEAPPMTNTTSLILAIWILTTI